MDKDGKILPNLIHHNRLHTFKIRQEETPETDVDKPDEAEDPDKPDEPEDPNDQDILPDNFPPDPPEEDKSDSEDDVQDSECENAPDQGEDPDTGDGDTGDVTGGIILDIVQAARHHNKLCYKVILQGRSERPWRWEEEVPADIVTRFHKTNTMKGKTKKHNKKHSYFIKT